MSFIDSVQTSAHRSRADCLFYIISNSESVKAVLARKFHTDEMKNKFFLINGLVFQSKDTKRKLLLVTKLCRAMYVFKNLSFQLSHTEAFILTLPKSYDFSKLF